MQVLAVGAFAEVSRSMHELLARAAEVGAIRLWRRHGCRSEKEAKSLVSTKLTARLGAAFVRAQAKLLDFSPVSSLLGFGFSPLVLSSCLILRCPVRRRRCLLEYSSTHRSDGLTKRNELCCEEPSAKKN